MNPRSTLGPSRIIVRDGRLRSGGQIENKTENVINRQSGAAQYPRSNERVVEGTEFDLQIVLQVFDRDGGFSYQDRSGTAHQGETQPCKPSSPTVCDWSSTPGWAAAPVAGERGELFGVPYSDLSASDDREAHLTLFARTTGAGAAMLTEALEMLGRTGYGADASVGHGAFDVEPDLLPCPELDDVAGAGGFVALSTFQPAAGDPVEDSGRSSRQVREARP